MNRKELLQFIKENGGNFRSNCPSCGNKNTFIVNTQDGFYFYYCFHSSCNTKGRIEKELSLDDIRNSYNTTSTITGRLSGGSLVGNYNSMESMEGGRFLIPDHWQSPLQNKECFRFLEYWKLLPAYAERRVSIFYDPKLHRCVFLIKNLQGEIKGAIGRSLTWDIFPKWYVYARIGHCLGIIPAKNRTKQILLVEDFLSATIASSTIDSASLLGTFIPNDAITSLLGYSKVFIALDKDASDKSFKIQKQLAPYIDTKVLLIEKDIKYFNSDELKKLEKEMLCA